jgi:bifunctional DNA-binding transcriptional regulator/antitoxin component of YhaV-PrlF toxin-antitoxin module
MQLQKRLSRIYKGKEYSKYVIIIPPKDIEKLGWKDQDVLESNIEEGKIIIGKKESHRN